FRPWQLTLGSLAVNVAVGWLLLSGRRFVPGMLLIPAGVLDVFDGGVARMRGQDSRLGAFLDSTLDRVSDGILFGCLFWSLAGQGDCRSPGHLHAGHLAGSEPDPCGGRGAGDHAVGGSVPAAGAVRGPDDRPDGARSAPPSAGGADRAGWADRGPARVVGLAA